MENVIIYSDEDDDMFDETICDKCESEYWARHDY